MSPSPGVPQALTLASSLAACLLLLISIAEPPLYPGQPAQQPPLHYIDIARSAGLSVPNVFGGVDRKEYILETTGNGAAVFDYDGDGDNDIFIPAGSRFGMETPPLPQLYRNDGTGRFTEVARAAGLTVTGWGQAACVADVDNDGHPDLFVTYYGHNILYRNRGDGTFSDVTAQAGLPVTGTRWGAGCAFLDFDRDGLIDVFVSNYVDFNLANTPKPGERPECTWKGLDVMCGPRGLPAARNILYKNAGNGKFEDVSQQAGILKPGGRYGLGVLAADFDNDGWPDIYVACDMTPSLLFRNRADGTFEERGAPAGVAFNFDGQLQAGMGVALGDYEGNGFLDIAKTNFSGDLPSLFQNEDGRFFSDLARPAGFGVNQLLGWGIAFVDADEDGWPDLVMANGHVYPEVDRASVGDRHLQKTLFYRNLGNGRFADLTAAAGPAFAAQRPARGLATGDLDGDGHPEIVIVNMNETPSLLKNTAAAGRSVLVRLTGTKSNRSAIGARVELTAGGRTQVQEVTSGGSFFSCHDLGLHFGVGNAPEIERIAVRWPAGGRQEFTGVRPGHVIRITEGAPAPEAASFRKTVTKPAP